MANALCSHCRKPLGDPSHCVCDHPNPIPPFEKKDYPTIKLTVTGRVDFSKYNETGQARARRAETAPRPATTPAENEDEAAESQDPPTSSANTNASDPSSATRANAPPSIDVAEDVSATPQSTQPLDEGPNLDEQAPNQDGQRDLDRRTPFQVIFRQLAVVFDVRQTTQLVLTGFGQLIWPLLAIKRRIRNAFARRGGGEAPAR